MSRLFKGFTLNEGYTDLGTLSVDITFVEYPILPQDFQSNEPPIATSPVFQLIDSATGMELKGKRVVFTIHGFGSDPDVVSTQYSNENGFVSFPIPVLPTYLLPDDKSVVPVPVQIQGAPENRPDEWFLKVDLSATTYYTRIMNLTISSNKLDVFDGDSSHYIIQPQIDLDPDDYSAVGYSSTGDVYGYEIISDSWVLVDTLEFWKFSNPAGLNQPFDGFYTPSGTSGTLTSGTLGSTGFEQYSLKVLTPQICPVIIDISIYEPDGVDPIHTDTLNPIFPDTKNIYKIDFAYSPVTPTDDSPTMEDIETAAGITFSVPFASFLAANNIETVQDVRRAGPLKYMTGIPDPEASEVAVLQSYTDLFFLLNNLPGVTAVRVAGYNSVYDIAIAPRNVFISDMGLGPEYTFALARAHDLAVKRIGLVSNVLAASLNDAQLKIPVNYAGQNSDAYSIFRPNCACDDCKSGISPFAYLADLIRYSGGHVYYDNTGYPNDLPGFLELLEDTFYQSFGSFLVDCDTLHDEFCRVRLATEVLFKLKEFTEGTIDPDKLLVLETEYKQYLQLTYNTLLLQMGTSFEEVRSVFIAGTDKDDLSAKLADKLGIPFYAPEELPAEIRTTDILWLSLNETGDHELTEARLQVVFGYRNISESILTPTPDGLVLDWKKSYLKDIWTKQDYPITAYTRQGIESLITPTILDEWQPIIDPDIIGLDDFQYYARDYVFGIYRLRKLNTDNFLEYYVNPAVTPTLFSRSSADMLNKIVRTTEDVGDDVIYENVIQLETASTVWNNFTLNNRITTGTNVDFYLQTISQPYGTEPMMRYFRVGTIVDVETDEPSDTILITLNHSASDALGGGVWANDGHVKLVKEGSGIEYDNNPGTSSSYRIDSVSIVDDEITIVFNSAVDFPAAVTFLTDAELIYLKEVSLFTDLIPNPEDHDSEDGLVTDLFTPDQHSYTPYYSSTPITYTVWTSAGWTPGANYAGLKDVYNALMNGSISDTESYRDLILDKLHLSLDQYNRMMELLIICENYLLAMYTNPRPTVLELYELSSYFRVSSKHALRSIWVNEEITYDEGDPIYLQLTKRDFWKSVSEPPIGSWDPSLQTIPGTRPIIDPEFIGLTDIVDGPQGQTYKDLLEARIGELQTAKTGILDLLIPYDPVDGFSNVLNLINTGNSSSAYSLPSGYSTLNQLVNDVKSKNEFTSRDATLAMTEVFGMTKAEFLKFISVKNEYETTGYLIDSDSLSQLNIAVDIAVLGFKRHWLWFGEPSTTWIEQEAGFKYYDILKMRIDSVRAGIENRQLWQRTLKQWNSTPIIDPDIVPAENLVSFVPGNVAHDFWTDRYTFYNDRVDDYKANFSSIITNPVTLLGGYVDWLCHVIYQEAFSVTTSLAYFLNLKTQEEAGEWIQPYVEQLGLTMSSYRVLRKIYDVLEPLGPTDPVPLIDSEYEDVYDIWLQTEKQKLHFYNYRLEEYQSDIIAPDPIPLGYPVLLSHVEFHEYKQNINSFPLTNLPIYNTWRSSFAARRLWLNFLKSRNERLSEIEKYWENVLRETEDISMQVYRNALIRALSVNCETLEQAADRLAKTLFIETKDNCCVKHTRISQAIETLQGFIFALNNGVYDESLSDFTLHAINFDREWEWLGSYAAWRSAIFVFLYPENILYPTLKRYQSPAFRKLANELTNASRLTPQDACRKAGQYEDYFKDISNLDVKFSTRATASMPRINANICCDDIMYDTPVTYFFAQSKVSGISYWSAKMHDDTSGYSHGFWEELPLKKDVELLACYPVNHNSKRELWLFYTYLIKGEIKLAYIKRDLKNRTDWTAEFEVEVPDEIDLNNSSSLGGSIVTIKGLPKHISAAQSSISWDYLSFILSYQFNNTFYHVHLRFKNDERLSFEAPEIIDQRSYFILNESKPLAVLRHWNFTNIYGLTVVFSTCSMSINYNLNAPEQSFTSIPYPSGITSIHGFSKLIGVYQGHYGALFAATLFYVYADLNENIFVVTLTFDLADSNSLDYTWGTAELPNLPLEFQQFQRITPIFREDSDQQIYFGVKWNNNPNTWLSSRLLQNTAPYQSILVTDLYAISPTAVVDAEVQSAECISNLQIRKNEIENTFNYNTNSGYGGVVTQYNCPQINLEYIYEVYYFVPMLIALDQQRRGQFEAALDWYRSVYDYTENIVSNRKIFYGLVLEESLTNVFNRPSDWLLDPLNPHLIAKTRANAYTRYTIMNIVQCLSGYGDREFTTDTSETVPRARQLYTAALDLLSVSELDVLPNECLIEAHCFPAEITKNIIGTSWENLFNEMMNQLGAISDPLVLEETRNNVITIFEDVELTIPEKFAAAFDAINDALAGLVIIPPSLEEVMEGTAQRITVAMEFLESPLYFGDRTATYMQTVADSFDLAVSAISGISVADLNANTYNASVLQLADPDASVASSYGFDFMNGAGVQNLSGDRSYDPLHPTDMARRANLNFSNTVPFLFSGTEVSIGYVPLIDYEFCIPSNPVYSSIQLKLNVELYKIFNCRNIAGMRRELDAYGAPTDSTSGIPIIGASGNLILPGLNTFKPSQYRFAVLVERAKQLIQQAQQLEAQFLSAMEKRDAEYYSLLKARQDLGIAKQTIKLQDLRIKQAYNEKEMADVQWERADESYKNFDNWITDGLTDFEIASMTLLSITAGLQLAAGIVAISAESQYSGGLSSFASSMGTMASIMSQQASYERRENEWKYQRQLADFDRRLANQQIKIAEDNIRIVGQEREIAEMNSQFANDTLEFLKNKFTNAELYNWMSNVLEGVYAYMLNLSTSVARTAEGQLYFERQEQAGPFILDDYWESPSDNYVASATGAGNADRRGLTGSARLLQDITRLDQYAFETNKRKLQLTKTISLAQNFPEAFQQFRQTGVLNFELTNQMFDYDFPGHYLRLINSVKTSVIGLVPVYGGIKASLTSETISYVVIGGNTFQRIPINRMHSDMVALTSPTNATGLFELTPLNGEMLNPFEGMGVESRWEFKMPGFSNRMDYDQIGDILITVEYTALDSFVYRQQVLAELDNETSFNRAFSFKNNFPDQWYELANVLDGAEEFEVTFTTKRADFPAGLDINHATRLILYFVRADDYVDEVNVADFNIASNTNTYEGSTVNGILNAQNLLIGNSPLHPCNPSLTWRLKFDNEGDVNRLLFANEKITDILFVITCDATLPNYPV